jgi:hypothetical protein
MKLFFHLLLLALLLCARDGWAQQPAPSASPNQSAGRDIVLSVVLDKGVADSVTKTGDVTITFILKNISNEIVKYRYAPDATVILYAVDDSGKTSRVYPQPESPFGAPLHLNVVGSKELGPNATEVIHINVPLTVFQKKRQKFKALVVVNGRGEVFSEPFFFPLKSN